MNLTVVAIVILILLPLGSPPQGQGATKEALGSLRSEIVESGAVKDTDAATATKSEHAAAKAVDKAASASPRQLRAESERWAEYYAHQYQVPAGLVKAIIEQESGWNPRAVSKKGAAGLMQLMPATAKRFGVRNRFGVRENIRGGVAYLAWLSEQCNGDVQLMSAAYYGGEYQLTSRRSEHSSRDVQAYVQRVAQKYQARQAPTGTLASNYQIATK
ncbi:MAG: lytic transglycosylase domain-containing protein [Terriglobales bacterium]